MDSIEAEVFNDETKRDSRGRKVISREERERLLAAYRESGLTQRVFCEREAINYHTFVSWLGKARNQTAVAPQSKRPGFEEIFVERSEATEPSATVQVRLAGGEVVSGSDLNAVAQLVRLLRGS